MKEEIKFLYANEQKKPMSIQMYGISYCDGSYHHTRKNSLITVIEYIYSGEGYIIKDGVKTRVGAGSIYILPAGTDHEYFSSDKNPWVKIFMNIYGELPITLLSGFFLNDKYIFDGGETKPLFDVIKTLISSNETTEELNDRLCRIYFEILFRLNAEYHLESKNYEAIALKKYIDNNSSRIISNKELAKQIFRSTDYCIKLFKSEFNITPYDYQLEMKIKTAKLMLCDTFIPISEIAKTVGYYDTQYFSNLFKSKCGMSPREYRKTKRLIKNNKTGN